MRTSRPAGPAADTVEETGQRPDPEDPEDDQTPPEEGVDEDWPGPIEE